MGANSSAFITGATGFIGRYVVRNLLTQGHTVHALVRPASRKSRASIIQDLNDHAAQSAGVLAIVEGDLAHKCMALSDADLELIAGTDHVFHLAALYDLEASTDNLTLANTTGTQNLCDCLVERSYAGRLHHVSSIAVAGDYSGTYKESMFDEGQTHPHPYHRSKFEAEKIVRDSSLDYRVYRPGSVIGHSETGFIDSIDGIYYAFAGIASAASILPSWVKIPIPKISGGLNVVPVDFVANALTHISLNSDSKEKTFHLTDPSSPSITKLLATLLKVAGGPRLGQMPGKLPIPAPAKALSMLPIFKAIKGGFLEEFDMPPEEVFEAMNLKVKFDSSHTLAALTGTDIACPEFKSYAKYIYRYYTDHLNPALHREDFYREKLSGKLIVITGASRGIGQSAAEIAGKAGAHVILVARNADDLATVTKGIQERGGQATAYQADLSSYDDIDSIAERIINDLGPIDALIHNAARSIRRPIGESLERFHDFERTMRLNYFAPVRLTLKLLPSLIETQGSVVMVLTLGVLMPGPFFSAYLPTKAALDVFGDVLASEYTHRGLHVASIYLPLVKTAMMAPTKEYADRVDLMTPTKAAHMILDGVAHRKRRVMLPVGRLFSLANRLAPGPTSRVLNLLRRTFPVATETSEFPMEQAIISQTIGGSPI